MWEPGSDGAKDRAVVGIVQREARVAIRQMPCENVAVGVLRGA